MNNSTNNLRKQIARLFNQTDNASPANRSDNISEAMQLIEAYVHTQTTDTKQEIVYEIMRGQHGHDEVTIVKSLQEDVDDLTKEELKELNKS